MDEFERAQRSLAIELRVLCERAGASNASLLRAVRAALPIIESLTLSLPPPDGSGSTSGAQHA